VMKLWVVMVVAVMGGEGVRVTGVVCMCVCVCMYYILCVCVYVL